MDFQRCFGGVKAFKSLGGMKEYIVLNGDGMRMFSQTSPVFLGVLLYVGIVGVCLIVASLSTIDKRSCNYGRICVISVSFV